MRFALPVWLLLFAVPANAIERVSPDAFLDFAEGKTLTFSIIGGGALVGIEEFISRRLSVWRTSEGRCVYGIITVENSQVCFYYEELDRTKDCWWMFRDGDRLLARIADFSNSHTQEVTDISTDGVSCPTVPSV
ncbi:MAG: hypothetical protein HKN27_10220, partial [Silicimonas sp.]|nr:hypothetical protein [Silicimonas sp.]